MLAAFALVLGIGILRGESSMENYIKLRKTRDILEKTVKNLETENRYLSQEIVKLQKSKSYARKVLRDKYHLTEQDEYIEFFSE